MTPPPRRDEIRLLLVDDDPTIIRAYGNLLERNGVTVVSAPSGEAATRLVKTEAFDVIVSDIVMPAMTGLEFLRQVREHDLEVPVILVTGSPGLESTRLAVEHGAFRYLAKPVDGRELWETVSRAARLHKMAKLKRDALGLGGAGGPRFGEHAAVDVRFAKAMSLAWTAFQPIVHWRERRVFGFEALLRSDEPLMSQPGDILEAAERLGRLPEVGRTVRAKVAAAEPRLPRPAKLLVNLHASDLNDEELYAEHSPLSRIARRVVLEITERASLHGVKNLAASATRLKVLGFQIAIDDLGAGYAGLTSFSQLEPQLAKIDISLVRGVDTDVRRQGIIRAMKTLCDELGIIVVAEGVETQPERDMLLELGFDLLQGHLFGRPSRGFDAPHW